MDRIVAIARAKAMPFVRAYHRRHGLPCPADPNGARPVLWEAILGPSKPIAVLGRCEDALGTYIHFLMHDGTRGGLRAMAILMRHVMRAYPRAFWYTQPHDAAMIRHYKRIGARMVNAEHARTLFVNPSERKAA